MSKEKQGTAYYSKTGSITNGSSFYQTDDQGNPQEAEAHTIATASVSGGETSTNYKCTFTLTVEVSGEMANSLTEGDAKLILNGMGINDGEEELDLAGLSSSEEKTTYKADFTISGNESESLTGYLVLNNTDKDQSELAGKELKVKLTIESNSLSCQVVEYIINLKTITTIIIQKRAHNISVLNKGQLIILYINNFAYGRALFLFVI